MNGRKRMVIPYFIEDLMKHPILKNDEILSLFAEYKKTGDISLRDKIILGNQRFILKVSRKYFGMVSALEIEDLVNVGNVGLLRAIEKFDPKINPNFLAYSLFWIKSQIFELLFDNYSQVKISRGTLENLLRYKKVLRKMEMTSSDNISSEFVSEETGLSQESLEELKVLGQSNVSLDQSFGEEGDDTDRCLHDSLQDTRKTPEESFLSKFQSEKILDLLCVLEEREKEILMWRYGCIDEKFHTLEFVAEKFNVTRERIRQIETIALKKLRKASKNGFKKENLRKPDVLCFNNTAKPCVQSPA
jgi:RNA polymerase primary sigma factor